jgi:dipeptidyl aminopeptidase/acylaminoacyl peptidase
VLQVIPMTQTKVTCVRILAIGWLIGAAIPAPGEEPAKAIRDVRPVTFPAYEAYPGIEFYAPTAEDYARAIADRDLVMERLTYRSGGLDVYAYLYRPAASPKDGRMPVVVFNRGSYVRDEFAPEVLMSTRRLAREGYLIVAPMLRGSGGAQGHDGLGEGDLDDLFNVMGVIRDIPYADPQRVFLYGESRGGIMCLLAARDAFPARAMAVYGAITDLGAFLEGNANARRLAETIWPDFSLREAEVVESRSAVRWPEKIDIPVLLMNGGADGQVTPLHALRLASALQELGKPYEVRVFYGDNHMLTRRAEERDADAVKWFRRFDAPSISH